MKRNPIPIPGINIFKHQMFGGGTKRRGNLCGNPYKRHLRKSDKKCRHIRLSGFIKPVAADDFVVDVIKRSHSLLDVRIDSIKHQLVESDGVAMGEAFGQALS